jgi:biopolymer transport protein ExbD
MKIRTRPKPPPEIPQASVADVAFLLLIFFIATTQFETEFGIPLQLPGLGGGSVRVKRDNVLTVKTTAEGLVYVRDQVVPLREVRGLVRAELEANENLVVVIETAEDAAYAQMVDVLDEVKNAKAARISIKKVRK